jgi:hypothetical protein
MSMVLLTKYLHRSFALSQCGEKIGLDNPCVHVEMTATDLLASANPSIDDDAVKSAEARSKSTEDFEHLIAVIDGFTLSMPSAPWRLVWSP